MLPNREQEEKVKLNVEINGRKYKLNYWQYISYQNQMKIKELERKIDLLLGKDGKEKLESLLEEKC